MCRDCHSYDVKVKSARYEKHSTDWRLPFLPVIFQPGEQLESIRWRRFDTSRQSPPLADAATSRAALQALYSTT